MLGAQDLLQCFCYRLTWRPAAKIRNLKLWTHVSGYPQSIHAFSDCFLSYPTIRAAVACGCTFAILS